MLITNDGSLYKGNFIDDVIAGRGKYKWSDGRIYDGQWVNNMKHG